MNLNIRSRFGVVTDYWNGEPIRHATREEGARLDSWLLVSEEENGRNDRMVHVTDSRWERMDEPMSDVALCPCEYCHPVKTDRAGHEPGPDGKCVHCGYRDGDDSAEAIQGIISGLFPGLLEALAPITSARPLPTIPEGAPFLSERDLRIMDYSLRIVALAEMMDSGVAPQLLTSISVGVTKKLHSALDAAVPGDRFEALRQVGARLEDVANGMKAGTTAGVFLREAAPATENEPAPTAHTFLRKTPVSAYPRPDYAAEDAETLRNYMVQLPKIDAMKDDDTK